MRKSATGDLAKQLLSEGRTYKEVMEATGLSYSTVQHHASKLGLTRYARIDWSAVQAAYDAGASHADLMASFGLSSSNIRTARQRGYVVMTNSHESKRARRTHAERIAILEDAVTNLSVTVNWLAMTAVLVDRLIKGLAGGGSGS